MKIYDETSEPFMASVNGQPPTTVRRRLQTFKITDDESMKQFCKEMIKGRDIVGQQRINGIEYVLIMSIIPSKISIAGQSAKDLLQ